MSELKPCPFCGWGTIVDMGGLFSHAAGCNACGAKTKSYKTWEEAIFVWNRRVQPANEPPVRCGECANYQTQNCAAKHEQALMDFCSHGIRKPGGEQE